jgi:hypothetical protein
MPHPPKSCGCGISRYDDQKLMEMWERGRLADQVDLLQNTGKRSWIVCMAANTPWTVSIIFSSQRKNRDNI